MGKATNFQFCVHIYGLNRNKSPLKHTGKVAVGVVRDTRKFARHPYTAHRAVHFAIAQLSCFRSFRSTGTQRVSVGDGLFDTAAMTAQNTTYRTYSSIVCVARQSDGIPWESRHSATIVCGAMTHYLAGSGWQGGYTVHASLSVFSPSNRPPFGVLSSLATSQPPSLRYPSDTLRHHRCVRSCLKPETSAQITYTAWLICNRRDGHNLHQC